MFNRTRHWVGMATLLTAAMVFAAGCPGSRTAKEEKPLAKGQPEKHPEKGPHGGAVAEWDPSDESHAEFLVDHDKKQATVYILDGEIKMATPIEAETITVSLSHVKPAIEITLKADPQAGDPKGKASRFIGTHDALGKEMEFHGEISAKVGSTTYRGKFKEEEGPEHKHDKKK
jgi:hypothetical protein